MPAAAAAELEKYAAFEIQEQLEGDRVCIRFVTAWNTADQDVADLLAVLKTLPER